MFKRSITLVIAAALIGAFLAGPATAGVVVYEDGDKKIEIGGRIQLQFISAETGDGETEDEVLFRRLRPYIMGTVTKNWMGKIQFDFGKSFDQDEVAVKDAYMMYSGWNNHKLYIGNTKAVFSREFLTSSKRQQQIERGFVGDHNLGVPDRQLGFRLDGQNDSKRFTYALSLGGENVDPDIRRIDFDTPVNNSADWQEGLLVSARVDFHPAGYMKFDQGDFNSDEFKYSIGLGAFTWSDDGDVNSYTDPETGLCNDEKKCDLDNTSGYELSFGLRGRGLSIDAAYNIVEGDLIDSTFSGGIWRDGTSKLERPMIKIGYMLGIGDNDRNHLEIAGRWQEQDADNYTDPWSITDIGLNYFWNQHKVKAQLTYTIQDNVFGVVDDDLDILRLQWQFVF